MMISSLHSGASALSAFQKKVNVTANNIANVNTDGFKKSRVTMKSAENGGIEPDIQQIKTKSITKPSQEDGTTDEVELSNVDLSEEIPELIISQRSYEANLKSIKTSDQMLGSLLDIIG